MYSRIVTYSEFLNNKGNLRKYLDTIFSSIPNIVVYFPKSLTKEERHMIYTNSKGYMFEKLKESLNYSIRMWRDTKNEFSNISLHNTEYETRLEEFNLFHIDYQKRLNNLEEDIEKAKKELKHIRRIYNVCASLSSVCFLMLVYEYATKINLTYKCFNDFNLIDFNSFDFNSSLEIASYHW